MNKTLVTLTLLAACGTAGAGGFMPWTDIMKGADADADGMLSMPEVKDYQLGSRFTGFQPWMTDHFAELDADGNGLVTTAELAAGMKSMSMTGDQVSEAWTKGLGFMPREHE